MKIKKVITGGCSFSAKWGDKTWPHRLKEKCQNMEFIHTGFMGQGQELIQKKISLALFEELEKTSPEELCVIVMWSGTYRKAFYVNNKEFIEDLVESWIKKNRFGIPMQLCNLKTEIPDENLSILKDISKSPWELKYNNKEGWFTFNPSYDNMVHDIVDLYSKTYIDSLPATIISLENIIMLQNLCKIKNVKIYQSFYMSNTYKDIFDNKDNMNVNYLYKQLDLDSFISLEGIFDYLKKSQTHDTDYFEEDKNHPNIIGHEKWTNEVLLPKLINKGFFS